MGQRDHEAKLDRARDHLAALENESAAWLQTEPYLVSQHTHPKSGEQIVSVEPVGKPPNKLSVLVGECAHQIRTALNALAFDLARAHTGDPLPADIADGSEFPIFGDRPPKPNELTRRIGGVDPAARKIIEDLQPHHARKQYKFQPLWVLHELDRLDKHRELNPVLTYNSQLAIGGGDFQMSGFRQIAPIPCPLERKTDLFAYRSISNPQMEMYFGLKFLIAFPKRAPGYGGELAETVKWILRDVETRVLRPLTPFL